MWSFIGQYFFRELIALVLIAGVMVITVRYGIRAKRMSERVWMVILTALLGLLFMSLRLDYPFHGIIALSSWMLTLMIIGQVLLAYLAHVKIISTTAARLIGNGWHKILTGAIIVIIIISSIWHYSGPLKNEYKTVFFGTYFPVQRAVDAVIGDIELTKRHEKNISYNDLAVITAKLRPGDLLVKRNEWQMGNYWIPGYWTHAGIYIGNLNELSENISSEFVTALWRDHPEIATLLNTADEHFVLESVTDGVVLRPLAKIAKVDHFAAVRPNVTTDTMNTILESALSHYGESFDFVFDFQSDNAMFCSELVYKVYGPYLALEPTKKYNRVNLSPGNIIELYDKEQDNIIPSLTYVVFYDSDPKGGPAYEASREALRKTWQRKVPPTGYWGLD